MGVFEVVGVVGGRMAGLDEHLYRLQRSIDLTHLPREALQAAANRWAESAPLPADGASGPSGAATPAVDAGVTAGVSADDARLHAWLRWQVLSAARAPLGPEGSPMQDGALRIVISRGTPLAAGTGGDLPRVSVIRTDSDPFPETEPPAARPAVTLLAVPSPWHWAARQDLGSAWGSSIGNAARWRSTTKWLSYGPNMLASRLAAEAGCDDALLVATSSSGSAGGSGRLASLEALEGPTFAVAWGVDLPAGAASGDGDAARPCDLWVTPCPISRGLLPSVTASLAFADPTNVRVGWSQRGDGAAAGDAVTAAGERLSLIRAGRWAYTAAGSAAAQRLAVARDGALEGHAGGASGGHDPAGDLEALEGLGRVPLLEAAAESRTVVAMSAAKHVTAVARIVLPRGVLTEALASPNAAEAAAAAKLLDVAEPWTGGCRDGLVSVRFGPGHTELSREYFERLLPVGGAAPGDR
ncbi:hypothetical protein FNF29_02477 [Cafeteria roenbergensis]|uniref:Branched-chain-amino-acid aminotransferase n=1 Tax=Cafeteria roenbergensis TaxID=33653 RepID=A0A5A8CP29_CAFRO|nr:hypothetical protein FNF29_02477 [Cafeteria roenbergensis]|eukprot:KAA0154257.1 hypothetical protein FNF29_02477 [Cafeteria roenbergensis]